MQCSADQFDIHLENFTNGALQVDALKQWLYVRSTRIKTGNGLGSIESKNNQWNSLWSLLAGQEDNLDNESNIL